MTRLKVVADGPFGRMVADRLTALPWPADVAVRCSWRDVAAEYAAFDTRVHGSWLGIGFAHPSIRIGPLVRRGAAPCHDCYLRRRRQHRTDPHAEAIESAQAADPDLGVEGHPPWAAELAAGHAVRLASEGRTGEVVLIDAATLLITRHEVIPADGCGTCSFAEPVTSALHDLALR